MAAVFVDVPKNKIFWTSLISYTAGPTPWGLFLPGAVAAIIALRKSASMAPVICACLQLESELSSVYFASCGRGLMSTTRHRQDFQQTGLPMSADRSRCSALCEPQLTHTVYLWSHSFAVDSRNAHFFGRGWCTEKFVRSKVLDHIIANVLFRCRSRARYFAAFSLRKFIALKGRLHYTRRYKPPRASSRVFTRDGDVRQGLDLNDLQPGASTPYKRWSKCTMKK